MKMQMTTLITAFAATTAACSTTPDQTQSAKRQLMDLARQSPDDTLFARADFTGAAAHVTYTIDGQVSTRPLSGVATAAFTVTDDALRLTAFDTQVDEFSFEVAPSAESAITVDVANARVQLAAVDAAGGAVPSPLISLVDVGPEQVDAGVTPVVAGTAGISMLGFSGDYARTDALTTPIVAHFMINETDVLVDLEYQYTIAATSPVAATATLFVHYATSLPRDTVPL